MHVPPRSQGGAFGLQNSQAPLWNAPVNWQLFGSHMAIFDMYWNT